MCRACHRNILLSRVRWRTNTMTRHQLLEIVRSGRQLNITSNYIARRLTHLETNPITAEVLNRQNATSGDITCCFECECINCAGTRPADQVPAGTPSDRPGDSDSSDETDSSWGGDSSRKEPVNGWKPNPRRRIRRGAWGQGGERAGGGWGSASRRSHMTQQDYVKSWIISTYANAALGGDPPS